MSLFLVADIGGTNTRFALAEDSRLRTDTIRKVSNDAFDTFYAAMTHYLESCADRPSGVAVAIAGPVKGETGRLTNRPWTFETGQLASISGAEQAAIFNDLQAQGLGLPDPGSDALRAVREGRIDPAAPRIVVNVGTGLNIATVWQLPSGPHVTPAEAGHITLPARNEEQVALMAHLNDSHGFPAAEEVLSGRGLAELHEWRTGQDISPAEVSRRAAEGDAEAARSAALFCRILGQYAGDLALIQLAFGGVYLVGGVARSLLHALDGPDYGEGFTDKGRFGDFLAPIPTFLVEDDYAPLRGLARHLTRAGA